MLLTHAWAYLQTGTVAELASILHFSHHSGRSSSDLDLRLVKDNYAAMCKVLAMFMLMYRLRDHPLRTSPKMDIFDPLPHVPFCPFQPDPLPQKGHPIIFKKRSYLT